MTITKKKIVSKSAHAPRKANPGRKSPTTRNVGTHTVESGCNSKNGCSHTQTVDNKTGKVVKDSADSGDATDGAETLGNA